MDAVEFANAQHLQALASDGGAILDNEIEQLIAKKDDATAAAMAWRDLAIMFAKEKGVSSEELHKMFLAAKAVHTPKR